MIYDAGCMMQDKSIQNSKHEILTPSLSPLGLPGKGRGAIFEGIDTDTLRIC